MSEKLYHYTTINTALQYIIPNKNLRFGKIDNTNDPRETEDWSLTMQLTGNLYDVPFEDLQKEFNLEKKKARLLCLSQDQFEEGDLPPFSHYEILKKGFCRPRMWAHYAENHSGICLEFDKNKLISSIQNEVSGKGQFYGGPVTYANYSEDQHTATTFDLQQIQENGLGTTVKSQLRQYYHYVFFEKLIDWRDEAEYRFLQIPEENDGETFVDITQSLTNIYVGINYDHSHDQELSEAIEKGGYPNLQEPKQLHIRNSMPLLYPLIFSNQTI